MSSLTTQGSLPQVILGNHQSWVALYDRARRQVEPSCLSLADIIAAVQKQETIAYHSAQALRLHGSHEAADDLVAQHLDRWDASPSSMATWLELIALVVEQVIGIRVETAEQRLSWRLRHAPPVGLKGLVWERSLADLLAESETGGGIIVSVNTEQPFVLEIETMFTTFSEYVLPGHTRYLLTGLDRTDIRP